MASRGGIDRAQRRPSRAWWTVCKQGNCRAEVLTVAGAKGEVLPIFSGEGEAEMFVWLGGLSGDGWHVRESSAGEIVSVLYGPCAGARHVALDPPHDAAERGALDLVCLDRGPFVEGLIGRSRGNARTAGNAPKASFGV